MNFVTFTRYIKEQKGAVSEISYPYRTVDVPCPPSSSLPPVAPYTSIQTVYKITPGDVRSMENAVATYGAITAIVEVLPDFVFYHYGVYTNPSCTGSLLSHVVTIVGFGKTNKDESYWVVKNSFGGDWGEGGYFKMARGINMCGIEANAAFAALA